MTKLKRLTTRIFEGVFSHAGKIRDYNISKREWVLDGASVNYGNALELKELLEYDMQKEREYKYAFSAVAELIPHLAEFVSNLWQIHAFGEGNTRTTAVFLIKYLRSLGFDVTNDLFAKNSWYNRRRAPVIAYGRQMQINLHFPRRFVVF